MNCDLARTGTDLAGTPAVLIALALILLGIALALQGRGARRALAGLLLLCGAAALVIGAAPPARAACPGASNSLTVAQTSTNSGLAPWEAPSLIAGRVTNNGPDETFVTAVTVSIGTVTSAPGAARGSCDASDYVLLDTRMPVGRQLAAEGGTVLFSGARIGFLDKPGNQDACKGAVVELLYVAG